MRAVFKGSGPAGGFRTILEGPIVFDLLAEQTGVAQILGSENVPAGRYSAIRMTVDSIVATRGGEQENVAVQGASGELKLAGSVDVEPGKITTAILGFETKKSLKEQSDGSLVFKPVVRLIVKPARDPGTVQVLRSGFFAPARSTQEGEGLARLADGTLEVGVSDVGDVPVPTFSIGSKSVQESAGSVALAIVLNPTSDSPTFVDFNTADGTAVAPADYAPQPTTTLEFAPGVSSQTILVTIVDDQIDEVDETFQVVLSAATNADIDASAGAATVTIVDNDPLPVVSIFDESVYEFEGFAFLTVGIDRPSSRDVTARVITANGTAAAPDDYEPISTIVTIPAGETSTEAQVAIVDDNVQEDAEAFTASLSDATNAVVSAIDGQATVEIIGPNDLPPLPPIFNFGTDVKVNDNGAEIVWLSPAGRGRIHPLGPQRSGAKRQPSEGRGCARIIPGPAKYEDSPRQDLRSTSGSEQRYPLPDRVRRRGRSERSILGRVARAGPNCGPRLPRGICNVREWCRRRRVRGFGPRKSIEDTNSGGVTLNFVEHSLWINDITTPGGFFSMDITNVRQDPQNDDSNDFDFALTYDASSTDATITAIARCGDDFQGATSKTTADAEKGAAGPINFDVVVAQSITVDVPMGVGFNLIAVPVQMPASFSARDLSDLVDAQGGRVVAILKWNGGYQAWLRDIPDEKDFLIEPGHGYFVRVAIAPNNNTWSVTGPRFEAPVPLDFTAGFNLVAFPFVSPAGGYNARTLAQAIDPQGRDQGGAVAAILRWEGGFIAYLTDIPDQKIAEMGPIRAVHGYFVRMVQAVAGFGP